MYANRCNNRGGFELATPVPEYYGDFDFRAVALANPLPRLDNHDHRWHWAELEKLFREEYATYSNAG